MAVLTDKHKGKKCRFNKAIFCVFSQKENASCRCCYRDLRIKCTVPNRNPKCPDTKCTKCIPF